MKEREIKRESFILYKSFYEPISLLADEQLGRLFRCIYKWQIEGKADPEPDILMAFGFFINQFRIDNEKYLERCGKNRENGKLGGRPKKTNRFQKNQSVSKKAKKADNDNDNENENENGNVNGKVKSSLKMPFTDQNFIEAWNDLRAQPKWKRKTVSALQKSLDKLAKYDVHFATELVNTATERGYPGVVYDDTPTRYEQWQKSRPRHEEATPTQDVFSAYDD